MALDTVYHSLVVVAFIRLVEDKKGRGRRFKREGGPLTFSS